MHDRFRLIAPAALTLLAILLPVLRATADEKPATTTQPANKDVKKYVQVSNIAGKLTKVTLDSSEAVLEYHSGLGRYAKNEKMDLTFADEVKVWFLKPPQRLDENGDPKKRSPSELDKIKSHSGRTKGWYAGELSDIHSGQTVQVELSKLKDSTKKPASRDKSAPAEKEFMYVTQILVNGDERPPTQPEKKKP